MKLFFVLQHMAVIFQLISKFFIAAKFRANAYSPSKVIDFWSSYVALGDKVVAKK